MMITQALFAVLSKHGGRAGTAGSAELTVLGVVSSVGKLAETITCRVLSPKPSIRQKQRSSR
jgi:hypothetical protein